MKAFNYKQIKKNFRKSKCQKRQIKRKTFPEKFGNAGRRYIFDRI